MSGIIFDIQKVSLHDGPGIRTTVFFKGCNLRCIWCHNPESQNPEKEIMFYKNKCSGCGRCKNVSVDAENFICYNDAKEICGKEYSVNEVLVEILKDKIYYDNSNGGVTFSGGECMLQIDFLTEILKNCKEKGIHTAVDTAGHVPWEYFQKIMAYTDLFLYDVKTTDNDVHKKYTGVGNFRILDNLSNLLKSGKSVWVRVPVVPDVNDTEEEMERIKKLFEEWGYPEKVEFLPYHAMGEHKYASLGRETEEFEVPNKEKMEKLRKIVVPH